jgi:hypothetical protein
MYEVTSPQWCGALCCAALCCAEATPSHDTLCAKHAMVDGMSSMWCLIMLVKWCAYACCAFIEFFLTLGVLVRHAGCMVTDAGLWRHARGILAMAFCLACCLSLLFPLLPRANHCCVMCPQRCSLCCWVLCSFSLFVQQVAGSWPCSAWWRLCVCPHTVGCHGLLAAMLD